MGNELEDITPFVEYHKVLSEHLRVIETSTLQFLATIVTSMGSIGWAVNQSYKNCCFYAPDNILLFIACGGALMMLSWGLFYTLALAYNYRYLTVKELERLQTLPDDYTNYVSENQRRKMIGNGWTVDVIAHILSFMK